MIDLSIIIPVYNVEKYIENCLKSIYNQKSNSINFEVICVNDGSLDKSVQVIEKFIQNYNIQNLILLSQENRGASAARNLGIENAKGKYIWFIDSDDYISNNSFSIIEQHYKSEHSDYLLKFNYNIVNNGIITQSKLFNSKKEFILYNSYDFILTHDPSFLWLIIFKKEIIDNNNLRFIDGIKNIEDLEFNTRYFYYCNKVKQIKDHLYNYVDNQNSTSRTINNKHLIKLAEDSFIVHKSLYNFSKKISIKDKKIVLEVLNHSIIGFFYSMYYRPYNFSTFDSYYKKYIELGFLPITKFSTANVKMKFFIFMLNSSFFYYLMKLKRI